jgi:hydroxyquinol 1,2-dioxygenase
MRELTPETITDAVLDQMATTPDSRLKAIMASAVKHLHAFAREVNLAPGEWIKGIEFMTLAGKMCSPERQEFILLSDTLGLSALVNGLHDKTAIEEGTHTSLLGPFYREATPTLKAGSSIAQNPKPGSECVLYGHVTDAGGKPVANATVSIWQTGADGLYDIQSSATSVDYRGVFTSDAEGVYVLRTVKPLGYSIPMDGPVGAMVKAQARHGMRPAHIHFLVGAQAIANWSRHSICVTIRIWPMTSYSARRAISRSMSYPTIRTARSRACPASASTCGFRAKARPTRPAGGSAPIRRRS